MGRSREVTDEEKKARGTFRADRAAGPTVERPPIDPEVPKKLKESVEGSKMWRFLMRDGVCERGWFAEHDRPILIMFCQTWALYVRATDETLSWGFTDEDGKAAPWAVQRGRLADQLLSQMKTMGLNPRDSKNIQIGKDQKQENKGLPALTRPQIFMPPPAS